MSDYTPTDVALAQAVIDHFHCPDDKHSSWWLNTDELRHAFGPILAAHDATVRAEERARMSQRALDPVFGVPFDHDHDVAIVSAWITDEIHASAYPHHEEHCRSGSCGVQGGS